MEVTLSPELQAWIEELVRSGRYDSAPDVIETALHALRDSEQSRSAELAEFTEELDRRLGSLDRGEWEDPEAVRAELQRKSAERRRKLA